MFKKNYSYLIFAIIAMIYNAINFIFYPESISIWFLQFLGFLFLISAVNHALDIYNIYLQSKIDKLNQKIKEINKDICT